jgi:hypothetical protein
MGVLPPAAPAPPLRVDAGAGATRAEALDAGEEEELARALAELEAEEQRTLAAKR